MSESISNNSYNIIEEAKKINNLPLDNYIKYEQLLTESKINNSGSSIETITEMIPVASNFYLYNKSNLDIICEHIDSTQKNNIDDKSTLIENLQLNDCL